MTRASTLAAVLSLILMLIVIFNVVISPPETKPVSISGHPALAPAHVLAPPVPARGAVVMFSDRQGWNAAMDAAAKAIAEAGEIVVGFDTPRVLVEAARTPDGCLDLSEAIADATADARSRRRGGWDGRAARHCAGSGGNGRRRNPGLCHPRPVAAGSVRGRRPGLVHRRSGKRRTAVRRRPERAGGDRRFPLPAGDNAAGLARDRQRTSGRIEDRCLCRGCRSRGHCRARQLRLPGLCHHRPGASARAGRRFRRRRRRRIASRAPAGG